MAEGSKAAPCLKTLLLSRGKNRKHYGRDLGKGAVTWKEGQPWGWGHVGSSWGLRFPPQITLDALFDTWKDAKVSTCVLLQCKREKVGDISQLARLMALVVWDSSSRTRARIAKNL